jgi:hypothetical protein
MVTLSITATPPCDHQRSFRVSAQGEPEKWFASDTHLKRKHPEGCLGKQFPVLACRKPYAETPCKTSLNRVISAFFSVVYLASNSAVEAPRNRIFVPSHSIARCISSKDAESAPQLHTYASLVCGSTLCDKHQPVCTLLLMLVSNAIYLIHE